MRIAILDDYLKQSQRAADWSALAKTCEITVFDRPIRAAEAPEALKPFDVICLLRERTPFPRELIEALPNLKMLAVTGLYNRTLDVRETLGDAELMRPLQELGLIPAPSTPQEFAARIRADFAKWKEVLTTK